MAGVFGSQNRLERVSRSKRCRDPNGFALQSFAYFPNLQPDHRCRTMICLSFLILASPSTMCQTSPRGAIWFQMVSDGFRWLGGLMAGWLDGGTVAASSECREREGEGAPSRRPVYRVPHAGLFGRRVGARHSHNTSHATGYPAAATRPHGKSLAGECFALGRAGQAAAGCARVEGEVRMRPYVCAFVCRPRSVA